MVAPFSCDGFNTGDHSKWQCLLHTRGGSGSVKYRCEGNSGGVVMTL